MTISEPWDWRETALTQRPYRKEEQDVWDGTFMGQLEELHRHAAMIRRSLLIEWNIAYAKAFGRRKPW